jgi:hypothetical protein
VKFVNSIIQHLGFYKGKYLVFDRDYWLQTPARQKNSTKILEALLEVWKRTNDHIYESEQRKVRGYLQLSRDLIKSAPIVSVISPAEMQAYAIHMFDMFKTKLANFSLERIEIIPHRNNYNNNTPLDKMIPMTVQIIVSARGGVTFQLDFQKTY